MANDGWKRINEWKSVWIFEENGAQGSKQDRRSGTDRRSGADRRQKDSAAYFASGGVERRSGSERRVANERRTGWVRINTWKSIWQPSTETDAETEGARTG